MSILKVLFNYFSKSRNCDRLPGTAKETERLHNDRMADLLASKGFVEGFQFAATLQLRVPLRILELDGAIIKEGNPPESEEPWHGAWVPQTKSWKSMGLNINEFEPSSASHIGYVNRNEYLPFLKEIRCAVEFGESIETRIGLLREILRKEHYLKFVQKHEGENRIIDNFFPYVTDSIPGINKKISLSLRKSNLTTVKHLRSKTDQELLKLDGVGVASLKKIRSFTDNFCGDDMVDRFDMVSR